MNETLIYKNAFLIKSGIFFSQFPWNMFHCLDSYFDFSREKEKKTNCSLMWVCFISIKNHNFQNGFLLIWIWKQNAEKNKVRIYNFSKPFGQCMFILFGVWFFCFKRPNQIIVYHWFHSTRNFFLLLNKQIIYIFTWFT